MKTFTLDYNAIIDLEEKREPRYSQLLEIMKNNFDQVAITAVSASENPPIKNFSEFKTKIFAIAELRKIDNAQILKPMGIWDFSFWDWCLAGGGTMPKLKKDILTVLFPNFTLTEGVNSKIRNQLADVMTFWCHVYYKRDVFITSDNNFHKNSDKLKSIASNYHGKTIYIMRPDEVFVTIE